MSKKKKFYAVKRGRNVGIFHTWTECKKQVNHYSNARFKSFASMSDAMAFMGWKKSTKNLITKKKNSQKSLKQYQIEVDNEINSGKYFAVIYTDGGCRYASKDSEGQHTIQPDDKSAWAYLIEWYDANGKKQQDFDGNAQYGETNNQMEITAVNEAIQEIINLGFQTKPLLFVLDSQYVLNSINKGWIANWKRMGWKRAKGELKNKELWQQIDQNLQQLSNYNFIWTKGHYGNKGNEFVDQYLNKCMDEILL